jgi:hypothetical protein
VPRPARELALRARALRRFDAGIIDTPPSRSKRRFLLRLFEERGHHCLVESGTFLGDTVAFFVPHARRIVSVEIDDDLWRRAAERFREHPHVEILHGDAEAEIPRIVGELDEPALVWLDGHYSGAGTGRGNSDEPAVEVIEALGAAGVPAGSTLVVDDLRLFGREPGLPSLEALISAARRTWPDAEIRTGLDSLVIALPR